MDCKKCRNYKPEIQQSYGAECECLNFKPKQHPLDELVEEFHSESLDVDFRHYAEKLRYESMDEIAKHCGVDLNRYLKDNDKKHWIIKEK